MYDYIGVGAGSAGCVVAARTAERKCCCLKRVAETIRRSFEFQPPTPRCKIPIWIGVIVQFLSPS
jgi:choline dehydrogenase-like flavoprotein